jgi:hypothetical protein
MKHIKKFNESFLGNLFSRKKKESTKIGIDNDIAEEVLDKMTKDNTEISKGTDAFEIHIDDFSFYVRKISDSDYTLTIIRIDSDSSNWHKGLDVSMDLCSKIWNKAKIILKKPDSVDISTRFRNRKSM